MKIGDTVMYKPSLYKVDMTFERIYLGFVDEVSKSNNEIVHTSFMDDYNLYNHSIGAPHCYMFLADGLKYHKFLLTEKKMFDTNK